MPQLTLDCYYGHILDAYDTSGRSRRFLLGDDHAASVRIMRDAVLVGPHAIPDFLVSLFETRMLDGANGPRFPIVPEHGLADDWRTSPTHVICRTVLWQTYMLHNHGLFIGEDPLPAIYRTDGTRTPGTTATPLERAVRTAKTNSDMMDLYMLEVNSSTHVVDAQWTAWAEAQLPVRALEDYPPAQQMLVRKALLKLFLGRVKQQLYRAMPIVDGYSHIKNSPTVVTPVKTYIAAVRAALSRVLKTRLEPNIVRLDTFLWADRLLLLWIAMRTHKIYDDATLYGKRTTLGALYSAYYPSDELVMHEGCLKDVSIYILTSQIFPGMATLDDSLQHVLAKLWPLRCSARRYLKTVLQACTAHTYVLNALMTMTLVSMLGNYEYVGFDDAVSCIPLDQRLAVYATWIFGKPSKYAILSWMCGVKVACDADVAAVVKIIPEDIRHGSYGVVRDGKFVPHSDGAHAFETHETYLLSCHKEFLAFYMTELMPDMGEAFVETGCNMFALRRDLEAGMTHMRLHASSVNTMFDGTETSLGVLHTVLHNYIFHPRHHSAVGFVSEIMRLIDISSDVTPHPNVLTDSMVSVIQDVVWGMPLQRKIFDPSIMCQFHLSPGIARAFEIAAAYATVRSERADFMVQSAIVLLYSTRDQLQIQLIRLFANVMSYREEFMFTELPTEEYLTQLESARIDQGVTDNADLDLSRYTYEFCRAGGIKAHISRPSTGYLVSQHRVGDVDVCVDLDSGTDIGTCTTGTAQTDGKRANRSAAVTYGCTSDPVIGTNIPMSGAVINMSLLTQGTAQIDLFNIRCHKNPTIASLTTNTKHASFKDVTYRGVSTTCAHTVNVRRSLLGRKVFFRMKGLAVGRPSGRGHALMESYVLCSRCLKTIVCMDQYISGFMYECGRCRINRIHSYETTCIVCGCTHPSGLAHPPEIKRVDVTISFTDASLEHIAAGTPAAWSEQLVINNLRPGSDPRAPPVGEESREETVYLCKSHMLAFIRNSPAGRITLNLTDILWATWNKCRIKLTRTITGTTITYVGVSRPRDIDAAINDNNPATAIMPCLPIPDYLYEEYSDQETGTDRFLTRAQNTMVLVAGARRAKSGMRAAMRGTA